MLNKLAAINAQVAKQEASQARIEEAGRNIAYERLGESDEVMLRVMN